MAGAGADRAAQKYYFDVNISTQPGERRPYVLPDNSIAYLGTDSALMVDFSESERKVVLLRGEARFSVAHEPTRPFVVRTTYGEEIRAVGTEFSVQSREGATVAVVVSEGKVTVRAPRSQQEGSANIAAEIALTTDQQLIIPPQGVPVPESVDAAREMEWMMSFVDLRNETVGKVVAELNRRNQLQIVIDDASIVELVIPSIMRVDMSDPESFADFIAAPDLLRGEKFGIAAERVGPTMIRLKRNPGAIPPRSALKPQPQSRR